MVDAANIDKLFLRDRLAEGRGDRVAIRLDDRTNTYAEVDALASGYSLALRDAEVGPGDRVLLVLPDGVDFVGALFGVLRLGAVGVMINPGLGSEAITAIVSSARPGAAVVHDEHISHFRTAAGLEVPVIEVAPDMSLPTGEVDSFAAQTRDPALWLFSGGTTGSPKAVVQTHGSFANTTRLYGQGSLQLVEDDITIAVPKLYFGYATGSNLFFPFSVGASCVLFPEHPTAEALFEKIERHRPTVLVNVPSAVNQMVSHPGARTADLSSLRLATSAGEALPESLYRRWKDVFGVELLDGLGTAEMWHIFVTNTVDDVAPGTVGRVVPGFEIKACDEEGVEVPTGDVGRLWVKGDSLALGYWEDEEATKDAFRGEWFVGGDLVSIDESGYVTHSGRAGDALKVRGKWFRPQEVESVLLEHPDVAECAVIVVDDEAGLLIPVAFVVLSGTATEQDLVDWVLARLEPYKHPRRVYPVDRLPQTHLGKVDRGALREMAV